jgi:ferritin-like metal-binding protein YciE
LLDEPRLFDTRTFKEGDMSASNLRELLIEELKDIYDAEQRITKALPKMAKAADSQELKTAFQEHLRQTEQQIKRLEQVFDELDEPAKRKECKAMVGLLEEGEELMDEEDNPSDVLDAGLITAAQKVEHYEMAAYGSLRTWADLLGESKVVNLLQTTLDEEGETDKKLTEIAQSLNIEAMQDEDMERGEGEEVPVRATKRNHRSS